MCILISCLVTKEVVLTGAKCMSGAKAAGEKEGDASPSRWHAA